jgi:hypothetical protein
MRGVQFSECTIEVALPTNYQAGNGIHCDGIPTETSLVATGSDWTTINPGNLTSGIARMTWLPGRKRLPRQRARPHDGVSRGGSPTHLWRFFLWGR